MKRRGRKRLCILEEAGGNPREEGVADDFAGAWGAGAFRH